MSPLHASSLGKLWIDFCKKRGSACLKARLIRRPCLSSSQGRAASGTTSGVGLCLNHLCSTSAPTLAAGPNPPQRLKACARLRPALAISAALSCSAGPENSFVWFRRPPQTLQTLQTLRSASKHVPESLPLCPDLLHVSRPGSTAVPARLSHLGSPLAAAQAQKALLHGFEAAVWHPQTLQALQTSKHVPEGLPLHLSNPGNSLAAVQAQAALLRRPALAISAALSCSAGLETSFVRFRSCPFGTLKPSKPSAAPQSMCQKACHCAQPCCTLALKPWNPSNPPQRLKACARRLAAVPTLALATLAAP